MHVNRTGIVLKPNAGRVLFRPFSEEADQRVLRILARVLSLTEKEVSVTLEDVLNICHKEKPDGIIVQFGGQTPLNLAAGLEEALEGTSTKIIGTSVASIERAEDRKLFQVMLTELGLKQPPNGTATNAEEAIAAAAKVGYPVLVRPSYVLSGASMRVASHPDELEIFLKVCLVYFWCFIKRAFLTLHAPAEQNFSMPQN